MIPQDIKDIKNMTWAGLFWIIISDGAPWWTLIIGFIAGKHS